MPHVKTILHIEDHQDVAEMVCSLFDEYLVNWVIARTGSEGLQKARELHPDLVILDLIDAARHPRA